MTPSGGYSHVTLTVTDLAASGAWYQRALGLEVSAERTTPSWRRVVLRASSGLAIGLTAHNATPAGDRFDEQRVGMDHLSIACADAAEVSEWAEHFDKLGIEHGDVVDAGYANVLVVRDPDGIPLEFFAANA